VVGKLGIDLTVSPREVAAKQVLGYLNTGPLVSRTPLGEESGLCVLEIDVRADSPATEHVLASLSLPSHCLIAAVIRQGFAHVPGGDDRLQAEDTAIALIHDEVLGETVSLFDSPQG
jgi:trk system potassium uptake protein TrkA